MENRLTLMDGRKCERKKQKQRKKDSNLGTDSKMVQVNHYQMVIFNAVTYNLNVSICKAVEAQTSFVLWSPLSCSGTLFLGFIYLLTAPAIFPFLEIRSTLP